MTKILIIGLLFLLSSSQTDFLTEQKKFERVRTAITEKQEVIVQKLEENQLTLDNLNLIFVAYKDTNLLAIYAKKKQETTYKKILSYPICARSGELGPKRKQGDAQVPEGFYTINRFNPTSNFFLSLGVSYPNLADKKKSNASDLGGDIFIHGSCVTIGCLPMTNNYIKEIYLLAIHAKNNGQLKIPVYIFPFEMTDKNMEAYKTKYKDNTTLISFWDNLKDGYDKFIKNQKELSVKVTENGNYSF